MMVVIEISIATEDGEMPEHYGYYENFDSARKAIDALEKEYGKEESEV